MKRILIGGIRFYQKYISPATPPSCRYHPTCSTYALQAVEKHGAIKGGVMGLARIIRCNPFVAGGVDEVPDHFTIFRNPDNVDDEYIPGFMTAVDKELTEELTELLTKYDAHLKVSESLPSAEATLNKIADIKEITYDNLKAEFSAEELEYLEDVEILPASAQENFRFYTLSVTDSNEQYLRAVQNFEDDLDFGSDFPLVVLEEFGIWYTNSQKLMDRFLIERGITEADIANKSYYLWLVLKAIEREEKENHK